MTLCLPAAVRQRFLNLVASAYSTVSVDFLSTSLALPADAVETRE